MTFKPGQSGNPGGRPKENDEVKALARQHSTKAIERLVQWLNSDNAKASVAACTTILDRAWGKPTQTLDATVLHGSLDDLTTEQKREYAAALARQLGISNTSPVAGSA